MSVSYSYMLMHCQHLYQIGVAADFENLHRLKAIAAAAAAAAAATDAAVAVAAAVAAAAAASVYAAVLCRECSAGPHLDGGQCSAEID